MSDRAPLPFVRWLARSRAADRRARRWLGAAAAGATLIGVAAALDFGVRPAPRLVWNASASAPIGLWRIDPHAAYGVGDMVLAATPATHLDGRPIVSRAGAMGLMQVMPGTYAAMRRRYGLGSDPHDPRDNIMAGTAYLKLMHDRFGYPGLFAAYNAGPGRYAEHLATGRPLPGETRAYIAQLARAPATREMPPAVLSGESLFFALVRPEASTSAPPEATASDSLFAVRRPLGDHP